MVVKNLSKPITVQIKQPINPYPPTRHTAYTHILKVVNVVSVPSDNQSSVFIDIKNTTEVCFYNLVPIVSSLLYLYSGIQEAVCLR